MKVGLLTNIVSPHQLPLAQAIVEVVGAENYRYVHTEEFHAQRAKMGWSATVAAGIRVEPMGPESRTWLEAADLVYTEERDFELIGRRLAAGRRTFYVSERWLKPIGIGIGGRCRCRLPGWLRLLHPGYVKMVWRFLRFFGDPNFRYLAQGKWAERDMRLLARICGRRLRPQDIVRWGYFVAPSAVAEARHSAAGASAGMGGPKCRRVLWVGRLLDWKRVDTIIYAVAAVAKESSITLTIVGDGPERTRLMKLASVLDVAARELQLPTFRFRPSVPIGEVRKLMREHDVYVLASNGQEGWGAALNEALEEGMLAVGTFEAGSSSYLLPASNLFHAGDYHRLAELLADDIPRVEIGEWSAANAARRLLEMAS